MSKAAEAKCKVAKSKVDLALSKCVADTTKRIADQGANSAKVAAEARCRKDLLEIKLSDDRIACAHVASNSNDMKLYPGLVFQELKVNIFSVKTVILDDQKYLADERNTNSLRDMRAALMSADVEAVRDLLQSGVQSCLLHLVDTEHSGANPKAFTDVHFALPWEGLSHTGL